jgi:hypothetical protein
MNPSSICLGTENPLTHEVLLKLVLNYFKNKTANFFYKTEFFNRRHLDRKYAYCKWVWLLYESYWIIRKGGEEGLSWID